MLNLVLSFMLFLAPGFSWQRGKTIQTDYCNLFGSVYITEFPERADFLVFEEDSEAFADILVFETGNALYADKAGIWFFTNKEAFADFTIYFVESKSNANFSLYFTSFESFAGCNR